MEVLSCKVEFFLCQVFFCVLPSFCVLSGWMKAHLYESFVEILLGPIIFCWRCRDISLPAIIFGQCVVVHNSVASIKLFEAISAIVEPLATSFVRSI